MLCLEWGKKQMRMIKVAGVLVIVGMIFIVIGYVSNGCVSIMLKVITAFWAFLRIRRILPEARL